MFTKKKEIVKSDYFTLKVILFLSFLWIAKLPNIEHADFISDLMPPA